MHTNPTILHTKQSILSLLCVILGFLAQALHPFEVEQFLLALFRLIFLLLLRELRWHRMRVPLIRPRQPVRLVYVHPGLPVFP